jgi:arylsulfatase A-like enzyme
MTSPAPQIPAPPDAAEAAPPRADDASAPAGWRRLLLRPETALLGVALAGTVAAKYLTIRPHDPDHLAAEMVRAACSDLVFFGGAAALFAVLHAAWPSRVVSRVTLLGAALLAFWSLINAAWLISTGVQIQPGVLHAVVQDPTETRLIITKTIASAPRRFLVPGVVVAVCGSWFVWRLVRPRRPAPERRRHLARGGAWLAVVAVAVLARMAVGSAAVVSTWGEAIGFSSHWYALVRTVSDVASASEPDGDGRILPRVGERVLAVPDTPTERMPNVVIIFLESVSHKVTTLADPALDTTPHLARLAEEGVELVATHVNVPHTTKALFAGLTGATADLRNDAVESVLVDRPYESLATILARKGYRSAFFEMSRGPWEGAPGLFANMAFDWAWFRENLEDESAHLGWTNGDDFRIIEPMFEWVDADPAPFLLTMITTVAHDPYELPDWYEHEVHEEPFERYLDTVRFSDAFIAAVCAELEARGLVENTLVAVIGDHGEVFRPESKRGRWVAYEEAIRVPWVMRWPAGIEAGRRVEWPCLQIDLTPTILRLLGFGIDDAGFDGVDALEPGPADRRQFFSSWYRNSPVGYREGDRKYVYHPYTDVLFVYDLASDPEERSPTTLEGPEKDAVIERVRAWEQASYLVFPATRFRERMLYDHWRTFSSGRATSAYYVP